MVDGWIVSTLDTGGWMGGLRWEKHPLLTFKNLPSLLTLPVPGLSLSPSPTPHHLYLYVYVQYTHTHLYFYMHMHSWEHVRVM